MDVVLSEPAVKHGALSESDPREALSERSGEGDLPFKAACLEALVKW